MCHALFFRNVHQPKFIKRSVSVSIALLPFLIIKKYSESSCIAKKKTPVFYIKHPRILAQPICEITVPPFVAELRVFGTVPGFGMVPGLGTVPTFGEVLGFGTVPGFLKVRLAEFGSGSSSGINKKIFF